MINQNINESAKKIRKDIGQIDGLVNCFHYKGDTRKLNVKSNFFSTFSNYEEQAWDNVHNVNLKGSFLTSQAVIPYFEESRKGVIVNVSSTYGIVSPNKNIYGDSGINSPVAYATSKSAIIQLSKYLATHLAEKNIEVHYLGYYHKWHPQSCYYYAVEHGGFEPSPERTPGTYSKYNSIDDRIDDFHYYTTFTKFGIGRATYDAAQEIRNDEINREEGVALVRKYDGEFPERFADDIFEYLSIPEKEFPIASQMFEQPTMDRDYFDSLADTFRSPHLWKVENGIWKLRYSV
mgnify:CR=1 FL=1